MKEHYQAGQLDRLITFQKPVELQSAYGVISTQYEAESSPTPAHKPTGAGDEHGTEGEDDKTTTASQTDTFVIRYRPDVKATWRIAYEGQTYEVVSAVEGPGRHQWTKVKAKATDLLNPVA